MLLMPCLPLQREPLVAEVFVRLFIGPAALLNVVNLPASFRAEPNFPGVPNILNWFKITNVRVRISRRAQYAAGQRHIIPISPKRPSPTSCCTVALLYTQSKPVPGDLGHSKRSEDWEAYMGVFWSPGEL